MDGGVASSVNLAVAGDCDAAVVLVPSGPDAPSPFGDGPAAEIAAFAGTTYAVFADDDSLAAFGPNPLDPRCRVDSAVAGREQGRREAGPWRGSWAPDHPWQCGGAVSLSRSRRRTEVRDVMVLCAWGGSVRY